LGISLQRAGRASTALLLGNCLLAAPAAAAGPGIRFAPLLERDGGILELRNVAPPLRHLWLFEVLVAALYTVLNGEVLGSRPGAQLSRALFSTWFGDSPLDERLRRDLLAPASDTPGGRP
jgi:hypothetical protein